MSNETRFTVFVLLCAASVVRAQDAGVNLDPQQFDLSRLQDRTELAFEESALYYAVLDHARRVPGGELQQAADALLRQRWQESKRLRQWPFDEFPLFYDLTQRPEAYRGQPVTMRGHFIRLVKYAAGPNDFGIETLYEGWIVTPDSEAHPATVIFTEIPPGMPIGEELIDGVSVTGYFFKLHTYPSRDQKIRFAPMILAHTLTWTPSPGPTGWPFSRRSMIVGIAVLAAVAVVVALVSARRVRHLRDQRFRESVPESPPEFLSELAP